MCPSQELSNDLDMTANMTTDRSSDTGAETVGKGSAPTHAQGVAHRTPTGPRDQEMRPGTRAHKRAPGRPGTSTWKPGDSTPVCSGSRTPSAGMFGQAQVQRCPSPGMSPHVHDYTPQHGLGLARTPDSHLRQGLQAPLTASPCIESGGEGVWPGHCPSLPNAQTLGPGPPPLSPRGPGNPRSPLAPCGYRGQ